MKIKYGFRSNFRSFKSAITLAFLVLILNYNEAKAQWSALGAGANDMVYAISPDVAGTGIYCALNFGNISATKNWIQSSNGTAAPANLNANAYVNGYIYAIAVVGTKIYVGGDFTTAQGAGTYGGVACWNTATNSWSNLGTGASGSNKTVYSLLYDAANNLLYAGGEFTSMSGTAAANIAAYNLGTGTWSALGSGCTTLPAGSASGTTVGVYALTQCGTNIYAGGRFVNAGGVASNNIAAWNGSAWSTLTSGGQAGVMNITVVGPNVACAVWDAGVMALTSDGTNVYAGGDFDKAGGVTGYHNIGCWNTGTSAWSKLGTGMQLPLGSESGMAATLGDNANVWALTMFNGNLIAGGDFEQAGTIAPVGGNLFIAQWNGSAWSGFNTSCGTDLNSDVFALGVSGGYLYAGGQFSPTSPYYIAKYTGAGPTMTMNVGTGTTICSTGSVALSVSGATSYTWTTGTGLSCTNCSNPTASPTTTTVYTVTGTTSGCSSTKTVTITVVATPTLTVNSPTICIGSAAVLTASSASAYSWSTGAITNTISVSPGVGSTTYTVTGDNGSGCTATKTATVTVSDQPTLTISGSATHCTGSAMILTGSTTAGTYTWSANAGSVTTSTVSVNPGAGSVTYTLNGTNGACSNNTTLTVSVTATPTLTVNSPTVCAGQSAVLTAATANSYSWSTTETTNTISVSPGVGTTTYTVTGDNGNGCTSTKTATVTVSAQPTVSISGAAAHCSGSAMTLTGSTTAGTFTWSANAGGVSTSTVSVNPGLGNTTYTLNGSVGTCTATTTITVSVTPSPTLTVNSPTICSGQTATLTAATANNYSWSTTETTPSITVSPANTTTYTVTGDNGAGCTSTKTATVTVNPTPTVVISGAHVICQGQTITLSGATAASYTWMPGGTNGSTLSVTPPNGSHTYTLTGANGACTATDVATVDVSPSPTLSVNNASICSGQSVVLSASGATTFSWSANAGGVMSPTVSVNPTTTTVYTVGGIVGLCKDSVTTTVTVSPSPTLTLPANSYTVCLGNSATLGVNGATTYTWTTGTGLSCTNCQNPVSTPTTATIYTVSGTTGSCTSAASVTVSVNVNPLPTLTLSPSSNSICSSNSSTITVSGASTYTWSPGGSLSGTNGSTVTATPGTTTDYTVSGTDVNGCMNTSVVTITVSPTPTINISPVPPAACSGQSVVLNGGTASTYTWSSNAGGVNTATVSVTPNATTTYTLTGTTGSCTASAVATVTVNPLPTVGASTVVPAACGQSNGCIDTVLVSNGTPGYQYSWDHGITWSNAAQHCNIPTGSYEVVVKDLNGCLDSTSIAVSNLNGPPAPGVAAVA
ncbi:MAG: beta strand repeat-containing protein, partial [Bacteroidia bacterium]